jgi:DNA-binding MarR family transcriptional regulator/transcriptional regulator with XRE-family HTH domain
MGGKNPSATPTTFAERLDYLFRHVHPQHRPDLEYSYREVAEGATSMGHSITAPYVWQLRSGRRTNPGLAYVEALAAFFGVSPAYFLDPAGEDLVRARLSGHGERRGAPESDGTPRSYSPMEPSRGGAMPPGRPASPRRSRAHQAPSTTEALHRLRGVLWRASRELHVGSAHDNLSPTQATVLTIVHMQGPLRLPDLVALEGINPTMASRIVSELVRRGWVERSADPDDARSALLTATDAGAEISIRIRRHRTATLAAAMSTLPPEAIARIDAALPALEQLTRRLLDGRAAG